MQQPRADPDFPVNHFLSGPDVKRRRLSCPALLLEFSLDQYYSCGTAPCKELGYYLEIQTPDALAKESHQEKL